MTGLPRPRWCLKMPRKTFCPGRALLTPFAPQRDRCRVILFYRGPGTAQVSVRRISVHFQIPPETSTDLSTRRIGIWIRTLRQTPPRPVHQLVKRTFLRQLAAMRKTPLRSPVKTILFETSMELPQENQILLEAHPSKLRSCPAALELEPSRSLFHIKLVVHCHASCIL